MVNNFKYLIFLLVLSPFFSFSQTGPGGVGTGDGSSGPRNVLWLRSDVGVTQSGTVSAWADQSGNGLNAVQATPGLRPTYIASNPSLNGIPSIFFGPTGTNIHLLVADNDLLDDSPGMSFFMVLNPSSNGTYGILNKRTDVGANQSYRFYRNGVNLTSDISNGASSNIALSNAPNVFSSVYDQTLAGNKYNIYMNSTNNASSNVTTTLPNQASPLFIGNFNLGDNRSFDGDIAEIIIYKDALNAAERIIVENYLSQKYAISIGANDYFSSGGGSFVNDLVGIGTVDGTRKVSESGFSDALQIRERNSSLNTANEFVLFAHDNSAHAVSTADLGEVEITDRWARSWYLQNSGTVAMELRFDFGTAGLAPVGASSDYVLLYRPDLSSNYTRMFVNDYTIENTDQVVVDVSNLSLPSGYYTIGRGTQLIPGNLYSFQSGGWNDPLTWTTDPSGALRVPVSGVTPSGTDNITILTGRTVTMDSDDNDGLLLNVAGNLVLGNTSGHDFFSISGNGQIFMSGDGSSNDNFPTGSTTVFADSIVGGTVVVRGSGITLDENRTFNNVVLRMNSSTDIATMVSNYQINGNLSIETGIWQVNNGSATISRNITVYGDVQIDGTAELNVGSANARHEFNFYGDFINQGRAEFTNRVATNYNNEATDGIIDANFLSPTKSQTIQCFGITNFYRIEVNKGTDQTYILDIEASDPANFNLFGPADYGHGTIAQLTTNDNALGLLRGTVRLNANVNIPVLNNTGNYNISEAARLWVNGGSAAKPAGTAIVPYGTIQLSGGTIDAPINSGITTRANGNIVVSDGIMTVRQIRTSVNGPTNIGGYTQSGGEVNITGGAISTEYYAFSLTYPGNTFNISGGTLRVAGAPTGANTGGIFIASDVSNQSVTGGTVIMEINNNNNFKLTSRAPFWNVIMRKTGGSGTQVDLITGASGDGGNTTNILNPDLKVLNNLTIESGVTLDHNGNDVEIGSDFIIQAGGDYIYDITKPNTTSLTGSNNSVLALFNRSGDINDEQSFWNLSIDKPSDRVVTLQSGKTGANLVDNENNVLIVQGDKFELLGGTFNQTNHSIRILADTLINYGTLTIFNPANATTDNLVNSNNDLLKFRPQDFVLLTNSSAVFGNVRLNNESQIVTLRSNIYIQRLDYRHGRMNLGTYNLKLDRLDENLVNSQTRTDEDPAGNFSVEDMIITAGNASDGGLSLYVPAGGVNPGSINVTGSANTTSNPTVYYFPLGTGTTGLDASSEFTPANIRLLSASDDGYITVKVVNEKLATAGPYPLGNNLSDRYWIIDYSDFTTVPVVERLLFRSISRDDPNGAPDGFPANYVPGFVLEDIPYTRTAEINGGVTTTSSILNTSTRNIRIFFWGNTGSGNPVGGFNLTNAAYTAGDPSKFVGAPTIYYSSTARAGATNTAGQGNDTNFNNNDIWNNNNCWSTVGHYSTTNTGTFPQGGDIAILGFGLQNSTATVDNGQRSHWFFINADTEAAKLIFATQVRNANGIMVPRTSSFQPQLVINNDNNVDVTFGTVEGDGTFNVEVGCTSCNTNPNITVPVIANVTGDFGLFAAELSSRFDYDLVTSNNTSVRLPATFPTIYPNLHIKGGNGTGRTLLIPQNITVNRDLTVRENAILRLNDGAEGDIIVGRNLNFTINAGDETVEFSSTGNSRTLTINGDILTNTNDRIRVLNTTPSSLVHKLQLAGSINQSGGTIIDLFNGTGTNNNAILELIGNQNSNYTRGGTNVLDLYTVELNKSSKNVSFTFNDSFTLGGPTNGSEKALKLLVGTIVLNDAAINIDLTTGGANFSIPSTSGLQITQGTANVRGSNSGIALDGCIIIDGGTLDMHDPIGANNGNNFIEYSSSGNARITISAGNLIVGSQIRPITSANTGILKYRQTGGDVRIGTRAAPENTRGMLQIYNAGSEFTYTGGTLTIERRQSAPSIAALYLDPDDSDVTGTINIFNGNTPVGQTNFGINSLIALHNLVIDGTNSPTARIEINPLTITNSLTINSGATLNGNGINLIVGGDMENDGTYNAQNNETIFNSTTTQMLSGTGSNTFFRFTKDEIGSLELMFPINVGGLFRISNGTLNDNGNAINLAADAVIDGTHTSAGGNGLVFASGSPQELRRSSSGIGNVGVLSINNAAGVTIPDGNGYDFNINNGLRMQSGVFNVGGSAIVVGINADIVAVSPFSGSNMIRTNTSFTDNGVTKVFPANYTADFTFPVGQSFYTPVSFNFGAGGGNTFGSSVGSITVLPANEFHPTVDDGIDTNPPTGNDYDNVLQYYWSVTASGVTGLIADMEVRYDQSDVSITDGAFTEADYIAARILSQNNPTFNINKFTTAEVDEATNIVTFNFAGINTDGISGDYFAGLDPAIPDNVAIYTVDVSGDSDQDVYDNLVPGGGVPTGSVVIVPNGFTLTLNQDNTRFYSTEIQDGGILEVDNTTNHRLGNLTGIGTLRIISDGINANLPAFSGNFLSCSGGGLEYAGTGSYTILSGITTVRNLTLEGSGQRILANNNLTVCEDFILNGADFLNPNDRTIVINDGFIVNSGSFTINNGTLSVFGESLVIGGLCNFSGNSFKNFYGNFSLLNGDLLAGSSGTIAFRANLTYSGGIFNAGIASARIQFTGSSPQVITGNFTGTSKFNWLRINNLSGVAFLNNTQVGNRLELTEGIVFTGTNQLLLDQVAFINPTLGKQSSYVSGIMAKVLANNQTFTFPIGKGNRWRYLTIQAPSAGPRTWTAEYVDVAATTEPGVTNFTPTNAAIQTIAQGEYWRVSDGSATPSWVNARIGLSWGIESDVSASSVERQDLQIMAWNTVTSTWDNFGGTNFKAGHTQNQGDFRSSSTLGFSTRIVTLGSSTILNPLPITLISFTGQTKEGRNELTWITESELDNDYFVLEKSTDNAESFEEIARPPGKGTTNQQSTYKVVDQNPANGNNYYRLKQVDFNGDFSYAANMVVLYNEVSDYPYLDFNVYPNPTDYSDINLKFFSNHPEVEASIVIYDMQGRVVFKGSSTLFDDIAISLPNVIAQGIYLVEVSQGKIKRAHRLMIK